MFSKDKKLLKQNNMNEERKLLISGEKSLAIFKSAPSVYLPIHKFVDITFIFSDEDAHTALLPEEMKFKESMIEIMDNFPRITVKEDDKKDEKSLRPLPFFKRKEINPKSDKGNISDEHINNGRSQKELK